MRDAEVVKYVRCGRNEEQVADRLRHAHPAYGAVLVIESSKGGATAEELTREQASPRPKSTLCP